MLKATVQECREAFIAFRRINEEVRLPQKPAWRISRLQTLLKPVCISFEETQQKLLTDAGATHGAQGLGLNPPVREVGEPNTDWVARDKAFSATLSEYLSAQKALNAEEVEINYDPIPLKLFDDDEKTPADKRRQFSANDFMNCGKFLVEE